MVSALPKQLMAALCAMLLPHMAAAAQPTEYEVKAAFIHNIAKFVDWPVAPRTFGISRLCLLGKNPFGNAFDALQGKPVGGTIWDIVPVDAGASLKECRVLYISASESGRLGRILESIGNSPVLTMGDSDGYAGRGVMVNFYLEGNKVRFEINRDAAARAKIGISSQLLRVARIVRENGGER